ncbi:hypothetical protein CR513_13719, partial [Mucuna pruriens]
MSIPKKDKVITCLYHIFQKIMDLETPKEIQDEFEDNNKVKYVKLLGLKRKFELKKMKDKKSVKDYFGILIDIKIIVLVPEKFEAKVSEIVKSCNLQTLTITKLTIKLHAQEQKCSFREKYNGRHFRTHNLLITTKEKLK